MRRRGLGRRSLGRLAPTAIVGLVALLPFLSSRRPETLPAHRHAGARSAPGTAAPARGLASLPAAFVENRGQWPTEAGFVARKGPMTMRIEPQALGIQIEEPPKAVFVRLAFEGSGSGAQVVGSDRLAGAFHYFLGDDPGRWRRDVPGFSAVTCRGLYDGVDLRVHDRPDGFEYDLFLAPGSDPSRVVIRAEGVEGLAFDDDGGLSIRTVCGAIRQPPAIAWQVTADGARKPVRCRYRRIDESRFGFEIPDLDPSLAAVVDPGLVWSSFVGGSAWESVYAVAVDAIGAATVVGQTGSSNFPTTPGAYDPTYNGVAFSDVFVTRIDAGGTMLVYSTFVGGTNGEEARGVFVDGNGVATVSGTTSSSNFPTTPGAYDTSYSGSSDAFVFRLGATGGALLYSTFVGGSAGETGAVLAVDATGSAFVSGTTASSSFPTTPGAYQTTLLGSSDMFVTRLDPTGSAVVYSTLLGGSAGETGAGVMLDAAGLATVIGTTSSANFPTTPGALRSSLGGSSDAFVARLNATGTGLLFSTLLGGSAGDTGECLAVEASGNVAVVGVTSSTDFPTTPGAWDATLNGASDGFVSRIDSTGTALLSSTLIGGSSGDAVKVIALDRSGAAVVSGVTSSSDFPTTTGAFDSVQDGSGDAIGFRVTANAATLLYSTFLGGTSGETSEGMAIDALGQPVIGGTTSSGNFPLTPGAPDPSAFGSSEGFATRLDLLPLGAARFGSATWGCTGPPTLGVGSIPAVGNAAFSLLSWNAPPSSPGALAYSNAFLPSPIAIGPLQIWVDPFAPGFGLLDVASDPQGALTLPASLRPDPALAGLQVFLQAAWLDACTVGGISASHGLAIVVQP
jgi:hypothetical protein